MHLRRVFALLPLPFVVACGIPPRPTFDPRITKAMVEDAERQARTTDESVKDPGTSLDLQGLERVFANEPKVAAQIARPSRVLDYFRQGRPLEATYLATYWVPTDGDEAAALVNNSGNLSEAQTLRAVATLRGLCSCAPARVNYREIVRRDWSDMLAYLTESDPRADLSDVDPETGLAPLNEAKSAKMRAVLEHRGAIAQTKEQIGLTLALLEAKRAQEKLEKEIAEAERKAEEAEERAEKERKEAIREEQEQARKDEERAQAQEESREKKEREEAAWKAAFDGLDKFKADTIAARKQQHEQQMEALRQSQAQSGSSPRPSAPSRPRVSAATNARISELRAEAERKGREAEARRRELEAKIAADRQRAEAERRRLEEARRDAEAQQAATKASAAAASGPTALDCGARYSESVTGKSSEYLPRDVSTSVARDNASNQAHSTCRTYPLAKGCEGSAMMPKIEYTTATCKKHPHEDNYKCEMGARFWCLCNKCLLRGN